MAAHASLQACPLCCARLRPYEQAHARYGPPRPWTAHEPRLRQVLDAGPTAPGAARSAVDELVEVLDAATIASAKLVLSELVTNAITHGAVATRSRTKVAVWLSPSYVQIEVEDQGSGFEPLEPRPNLDRTGGRGLQIVDRLAAAWGVCIGPGTTVWCQLARPSASAAER